MKKIIIILLFTCINAFAISDEWVLPFGTTKEYVKENLSHFGDMSLKKDDAQGLQYATEYMGYKSEVVYLFKNNNLWGQVLFTDPAYYNIAYQIFLRRYGYPRRDAKGCHWISVGGANLLLSQKDNKTMIGYKKQ